MITVLLVGAGGFIGSIGRYLVGLWLAQPGGAARFFASTFIVNVVGCALIGVLAGLAARPLGAPSWLGGNGRAFLMVGVLGGFTTFSAFGSETFLLLKRGDTFAAFGYAGATVVLGLLAVWLGYRFTQA